MMIAATCTQSQVPSQAPPHHSFAWWVLKVAFSTGARSTSDHMNWYVCFTTTAQQHKSQYQQKQVTLLGLWLVPPYLAIGMHAYRFLIVWALYSSITGFFLHKASQKRMASHIPRTIFAWFLGVYRISVAAGVLGYILLLLFLFDPGILRQHILPAGLPFTMLWYGLYFGVLGRDSAEVASDRMAAVMGTGRRLSVSVKNCGMCGGNLPDFGTAGASRRGEDVGGERSVGALLRGGGGQSTLTLPCKHSFHVQCLQGWTIVGKKDTCPQVCRMCNAHVSSLFHSQCTYLLAIQCLEKVDLRQLYADKPWQTKNLHWCVGGGCGGEGGHVIAIVPTHCVHT